MHFFTICARNYLAMAAALNESITTHHPGSKLTIFVLDYGDIPERAAHLPLRAIEDAVPVEDYQKRLCYYDLLEVSTCVKANCFETLFAEGDDIVVYLDPDIYLFGPLTLLEPAFHDGSSAVLIPHVLSPLPADTRQPDDLAILRSGVYNLGFLALASSAATKTFLKWWGKKLQWQCFRDPGKGVFTDQRWMDFAPVFLEGVTTLKDPTYNVAYWNLHERQLSRSERGDWLINGAPLVFFHFSGFDAAKERSLSKHQDRVTKAEGPLSEMLAFYATRLRAHGHEELSRLKFPTVRFHCGAKWDDICRILYQWAVADGNIDLNPLRDNSFMSWMASVGPGKLVPRYIQVLLLLRPDVAAAFPVGPGQSLRRLVNWMKTSGAQEIGIDAALLEALGIIESRQKFVPRVTYVGYLKSHLGIGEAARGYVRALASSGAPLRLVDVSAAASSETGDYDIVRAYGVVGANGASDVDILHVNADELPSVAGAYASELTAPFRIGIWAWEASDFPDQWEDRFAMVDEIWVASHFIANAVSTKATCPVVVMPHVLSVPEPKMERAAFGLGEEYTFLVQFDFMSVAYRKNPEAAILAFKLAFPAGEPVRLLVKTMNGGRNPANLDRLKALAADPRVTFWDEAITDQARYNLLATVDCYVSLHRAEGYGLTLGESMAYGKPVIATGWSGNLEFMNVGNSILVPYTLRPLRFDEGPYKAGTVWAEPDIEAAATTMRDVYTRRGWAHALGAQAKKDIARGFAPEVIGKRVKARLETLAHAKQRVQTRTSALCLQTSDGAIRARPVSANRVLLLDFLRRPQIYFSRAPEAWSYYQSLGFSGLRRKVVAHALRAPNYQEKT